MSETYWLVEECCKECDRVLNTLELAHCSCCPGCGVIREPGTSFKVVRKVYSFTATLQPTNRKWWQFWKPKFKIVERKVYKDAEQ